MGLAGCFICWSGQFWRLKCLETYGLLKKDLVHNHVPTIQMIWIHSWLWEISSNFYGEWRLFREIHCKWLWNSWPSSLPNEQYTKYDLCENTSWNYRLWSCFVHDFRYHKYKNQHLRVAPLLDTNNWVWMKENLLKPLIAYFEIRLKTPVTALSICWLKLNHCLNYLVF